MAGKKKYESIEEAETAYAELEKKLGEQGTELGTLRKQIEQAQALQAQVQQWAPVVSWYAQNEAEIRRRWQLAEQAQGQNNAAGTQAQAQALAEQTPGYQFLTPQEKQQFIGEVTQHLSQQVLNPWTQQFMSAAQGHFDKWSQQQQAAQKSFTDVLWRTFQFVLPKDQVDRARAWHEEALKYADPSKLDPMAVAQDVLSIKGENQTLKQQLEELQRKQEEAAKAAIPSLGNGETHLLRPSATNEAPASREDRFSKVLEAVKTEHGQDGLNVLVNGR